MQPDTVAFAPLLADLGLDPAGATVVETAADAPDEALREELARALSGEGTLLLHVPRADDRSLARWRNALWPRGHVVAMARFREGRALRETLSGTRDLGASTLGGAVLVAHPRERVLSPTATVEKFDQNAAGWNGEPGRPGYAHFRWMRRLVGCFSPAPLTGRVLDFGCGAGWCGIESVLRAPECSLHAFDPSPEMIALARDNARRAGVRSFDARTGFGEDPPFPADGEEPYDLVISSGVVSFSPDREAWLDGLTRTVRPGGALVVGDIDRRSWGFGRRRRNRPLLPVRELNAQAPEDVRSGLERRGFRFLAGAGYQLTWPVPQLMHLSDTRLGGALSHPILWSNRLAAWIDRTGGGRLRGPFDSWVLSLRREE